MPTDDQDLMQRITDGDQAALAALYARYGGAVFSIALRVLADHAQAEEVTQDVFLRVWHHAEKWDPGKGRLLSWLMTLARHAAIDRIRQENRHPNLAEAPIDHLTSHLAVTARVNTADWANGQLLTELLAQLPEEQVQVIDLAYFQGMTHRDMAAALGLPLGTVKTRVRLALQKLRALWEEAVVPTDETGDR